MTESFQESRMAHIRMGRVVTIGLKLVLPFLGIFGVFLFVLNRRRFLAILRSVLGGKLILEFGITDKAL